MQEQTSPERISEPSRKKLSLESSPNKEIDSRWVQLKFSHNFASRSYFASCIQAGNIYIHGGFNAQIGIMKDMLICCMYDMPATWKEITPKNVKTCNPGHLRNHTISSYKSNLILVGGQKNVVQNNSHIYRFNLLSNTWSICKCVNEKGQSFNLALDSHCAVVYKTDLYLIGGYDANETKFMTSVVKISLDKISDDELTFQIIQSETMPAPRGNATCCLADNQIFLFGGGRVDESYNDLWIWNIESSTWTQQIKGLENIVWPQKRKGSTLVLHQQSNNLFLFGGIKTVTKQSNDVYVWMIAKKRWVKIHSNTNELYDPSPTIKQQLQSPSISNEKRRKQKMKANQTFGSFKIGLQTVTHSDNFNKVSDLQAEFAVRSQTKAQHVSTVTEFKRKMSVVQEKKYREFLNRKKKLLSNIESGYDKTKERRTHSPTSEALLFSLNSLGEQPRNQKNDFDLPKVIYNQDKGQVLGKKPCARDGHAALVHEELMIILGGDRHMVSFNDAYIFKLAKGTESLPHYE